jgi:hypothetical protein
MGASHEDQYTCLIISCSTVLGRRYVSDKSYREYQNTPFLFNAFLKICHYELMWKNIVELGGPEVTIWCMPNACWITKATNTHSEYVIIAFPLQQWLHKYDSMLRYMYIALAFTAYITLCVCNLNNNMMPIINGKTPGIGAEWCQFMKQ